MSESCSLGVIMKTNPNDNAFATAAATMTDIYETHGLTKREYFAGLAMQSQIQDHLATGIRPSPEAAAMMAVRCADALIAELNREVKE